MKRYLGVILFFLTLSCAEKDILDDYEFAYEQTPVLQSVEKVIGSVYYTGNSALTVHILSNSQISLYKNGKILKSFCKKGKGPGEAMSLHTTGLVNQNLYVWDGGLNRFTVFDEEGKLLEVIPINDTLVGGGNISQYDVDHIIVPMYSFEQKTSLVLFNIKTNTIVKHFFKSKLDFKKTGSVKNYLTSKVDDQRIAIMTQVDNFVTIYNMTSDKIEKKIDFKKYYKRKKKASDKSDFLFHLSEMFVDNEYLYIGRHADDKEDRGYYIVDKSTFDVVGFVRTYYIQPVRNNFKAMIVSNNDIGDYYRVIGVIPVKGRTGIKSQKIESQIMNPSESQGDMQQLIPDLPEIAKSLGLSAPGSVYSFKIFSEKSNIYLVPMLADHYTILHISGKTISKYELPLKQKSLDSMGCVDLKDGVLYFATMRTKYNYKYSITSGAIDKLESRSGNFAYNDGMLYPNEENSTLIQKKANVPIDYINLPYFSKNEYDVWLNRYINDLIIASEGEYTAIGYKYRNLLLLYKGKKVIREIVMPDKLKDYITTNEIEKHENPIDSSVYYTIRDRMYKMLRVIRDTVFTLRWGDTNRLLCIQADNNVVKSIVFRGLSLSDIAVEDDAMYFIAVDKNGDGEQGLYVLHNWRDYLGKTINWK